MYDTVAAVLGEVPPEATEPKRWRHGRDDVDLSTGEIVRTLTSNEDGLMLTLHRNGKVLKMERSLPKAYRGENISDLTGPAVAVALAVVDGEIGDLLGVHDLPTVGSWLPVRADYPRSVQLASEGAVLRTLDKYAGIEMAYKGRPVVGQSHSVTWSKGDIRLKAYGKFQETKRDERARGILRLEPGVFRARAFRQLLGITDTREPMTLLDVLTPDVHSRVHAKFAARLRGDLMSSKEINDLELVQEFLAFFGPRRTATLLGWATLFCINGVTSRADVLASGIGSVETRYRVLADYRRFRDELHLKGYTLSESEEPAADVEVMVHRLGRAAA